MAMEVLDFEADLRHRIQREVEGLVEREGGLMSGHIPLDLIDDKDVPVNKENLELIGRQLDDESEAKGTDGQIQPIMAGLVDGRAKLDVIDGFHRFATFKRRHQPTIYGTIIEVTLEELLDKRIQNTRNHSGLQFARASQWVHEAWALHPLSGRITATQAFVLGRVRSSTGKRLGLDTDEFKEIMAWTQAKANLWGVEPMTIYSYLHTNENVDLKLIQESRPQSTQSTSPNSLPQSTLSVIGKQIPGRSAVQLAVASAITEHRLGSSGTSSLLFDIKKMNDEEALTYIETVDYGAYKERLAQQQVLKFPEADVLRLGRVRDTSRVRPLQETADLTTLHVDLALNEGGYDKGRMQDVAADLKRIGQKLLDKAVQIETVLEGAPTQDQVREPISIERNITDFTNLLKSFLSDPQEPLVIQTDRELNMAQRAISRGRGAREALALLQSAVDTYSNQARE